MSLFTWTERRAGAHERCENERTNENDLTPFCLVQSVGRSYVRSYIFILGVVRQNSDAETNKIAFATCWMAAGVQIQRSDDKLKRKSKQQHKKMHTNSAMVLVFFVGSDRSSVTWCYECGKFACTILPERCAVQHLQSTCIQITSAQRDLQMNNLFWLVRFVVVVVGIIWIFGSLPLYCCCFCQHPSWLLIHNFTGNSIK